MYQKMQDHWLHNGPPTYMSVAGYLGLIKKRPSATKIDKVTGKQEMTGNWDDLFSQFTAAGGTVQ
ncbi:hypothetical protein POLEWNIK_00520 [Brevundimonas phage vB_BpoS-Polewnik]|nr:hypothetical protein POLEWNIK_00520 [Brevundimonas phage vB_BpoS-Polewnik]